MTKPTIFQLFGAVSHLCYLNSKEKGFWHEGKARNRDEMVALINSELYEALEAHRVNRWFKKIPADHGQSVAGMLNGTIALELETADRTEYLRRQFQDHVKSSVEDELADVFIRICDYVRGWETGLYERKNPSQVPDNFAEGILFLNRLVNDSDTAWHDWGYTLAFLQKFCDHWEIDLDQHVRWKMWYNSTRKPMHGKAY